MYIQIDIYVFTYHWLSCYSISSLKNIIQLIKLHIFTNNHQSDLGASVSAREELLNNISLGREQAVTAWCQVM